MAPMWRPNVPPDISMDARDSARLSSDASECTFADRDSAKLSSDATECPSKDRRLSSDPSESPFGDTERGKMRFVVSLDEPLPPRFQDLSNFMQSSASGSSSGYSGSAQRGNEAVDISMVACTTSATVSELAEGIGTSNKETAARRMSEVTHQLGIALRAGDTRRWRIRLPMLTIGFITWPVGIVAWLGLSWGTPLNAAGVFLSSVGGAALLLSMLPSDRRVIMMSSRFLLFVAIFLVGVNIYWVVAAAEDVGKGVCMSSRSLPVPCHFARVRLGLVVIYLVVLSFLVLRLVPLVRVARHQNALNVLRSVIGWYWVLNGLYWMATTFLTWPFEQMPDGLKLLPAVQGAADVIVGLLIRKAGVLDRIQHCLAWRSTEVAAAAGIAEMLGGQSIEEIMEAAQSSFRYVSAAQVTEAAFADNNPSPELLRLTQKGYLGHIDAFLSHSWHDDPGEKWAALQEWRRAFKQRHGREPRLWIDKFCVDPGKLDVALQCLPVYVAGCTRLLVLCGPTYLERLWCLLEVFVFLAMGGDIDLIEVKFLPSAAGASGQTIENMIASFDAGRARCTLDEDTARLQMIIAAGLPRSTGVNTLVKTMLQKFVDRQP